MQLSRESGCVEVDGGIGVESGWLLLANRGTKLTYARNAAAAGKVSSGLKVEGGTSA